MGTARRAQKAGWPRATPPSSCHLAPGGGGWPPFGCIAWCATTSGATLPSHERRRATLSAITSGERPGGGPLEWGPLDCGLAQTWYPLGRAPLEWGPLNCGLAQTWYPNRATVTRARFNPVPQVRQPATPPMGQEEPEQGGGRRPFPVAQTLVKGLLRALAPNGVDAEARWLPHSEGLTGDTQSSDLQSSAPHSSGPQAFLPAFSNPPPPGLPAHSLPQWTRRPPWPRSWGP